MIKIASRGWVNGRDKLLMDYLTDPDPADIWEALQEPPQPLPEPDHAQMIWDTFTALEEAAQALKGTEGLSDDDLTDNQKEARHQLFGHRYHEARGEVEWPLQPGSYSLVRSTCAQGF